MRKLRIAILIKTTSGGAWILPLVRELMRRGHEVVVIHPTGTGQLASSLSALGVTTVAVAFDFRFRPSLTTLRGLRQLRRTIVQLKPDLLNYHLYASALAGRAATMGLPIRRVHTVAGPLYLEVAIIRFFERFLWRLDDLIICCTEHVSRIYESLGCPTERRETIEFGIDIGEFTQRGTSALGRSATDATRRRKARSDLGLPEDAFLAVMISYVYAPKRLIHRGRGLKCHDVLLQAFKAFQQEHRDAHLLLVGKGYDAAGTKYRDALMTRFNVESDESVTWLGWTSDIRPCFEAADVNILPSLSEGSNRVVREATAMGVPSIVSDAGGLPETVDCATGWVVPRGNAQELASALASAYSAWRTGHLSMRADRLREDARRFDNQPLVMRTIEVMERLDEIPPRARRSATDGAVSG